MGNRQIRTSRDVWLVVHLVTGRPLQAYDTELSASVAIAETLSPTERATYGISHMYVFTYEPDAEGL